MTDIIDSGFVRLRDAGKDEAWLQRWIAEKPERLGLGQFEILDQELRQYGSRGGRLDILGYRRDLNTYYEIEVMLGECDADHGFRTLDYWARERIKHPNSKHLAVLVAEDLQGRYKTVLETLPQFLPFVGIELKTLRLEAAGGVATTFATVAVQPDILLQEEPTGGRVLIPHDEEWWRERHGSEYVELVYEIHRLCEEEIGSSRIDFTAASYVSLKKGRRAWLPMWPRKEGVYVYIPDPGQGTEGKPSDEYRKLSERLSALGIEPNWAYRYNAGANPVAFAIPRSQIRHPEIVAVLKQAYDSI